MANPCSVVMLGASGAVGGEVVNALAALPELTALTLLNRRMLNLTGDHISQHTVNVQDPETYHAFLPGHTAAICTLGIGEPSKTHPDTFVAIDKTAVLAFASACKAAGVRHFSILSAVGANSQSRVFYLRIKGELEAGLIALNFERLSIFQPSMILTPTNRYGFSQALMLAVWPKLSALLVGGLRKYRGVKVATLGTAMAKNLHTQGQGVEYVLWDAFQTLAVQV